MAAVGVAMMMPSLYLMFVLFVVRSICCSFYLLFVLFVVRSICCSFYLLFVLGNIYCQYDYISPSY